MAVQGFQRSRRRCSPLLGGSTNRNLFGRRNQVWPPLIARKFGVVDVRRVADLHIRAMTHPTAKVERFLAVAGDFMSLLDIARVLKRRMGARARHVPTRELPDRLIRIAALLDPGARQILPELGKMKNATGEKARRVLGWAPCSREDAIVATAESPMRFGLLKRSSKESSVDAAA
jgi:nucleoside-diphosphate-sugar epimerase